MGNHSGKLSFLESTQICCTGQLPKQMELQCGREEEPTATKSQAIDEKADASSPGTPDLDLKSEERLRRIEEAVHYAKLLVLKVISSKVLQPGKDIMINAMGVEGSKRDGRDGVVYFGNKLKSSKGHSREHLNDIKLPASDKELGEKHRGRHFQIAYDPFSDKYYIKDLSVGFGAFAKLDYPLVLRDNHLVHIGESFIVVNLMSTGPPRSQPRLRLKLFGGPCTGEVFFFNSNEFRNSPIRIGRMFNCEIQIEDSLISKYQCSLVFDADRGWVLTDGDVSAGRKSTNGTWYLPHRLYLSENTQMYEGMVFKANQTVFAVSLV